MRRTQQIFVAFIAASALMTAGCSSGVRSKQPEEQAEAEPVAPAAPVDVDALPNAAINPNAKGPFKRVFKIVDKKEAMEENPNYVVTVNTIDAGDYFTGVAQGAFAAASQLQTISLQHFVNLHEAEHGKKPNLEEVKDYLKRNNITLKGLYPYQIYGYDQQEGVVCVLEDTVERAKREGK